MLPYSSKFKFYVSFLRLAFFNQPTFTHCILHGSTIHILERQMIPSGYLHLQLQLQSEFPRPQKPTTTHSTDKSFSKRMNPFCSEGPSEQWKQDSKMKGDKSSFFTPLKHRTATEQGRKEAAATARWWTPTPLPKPNTGSPCPGPPFISCSGCPPYLPGCFTNLTDKIHIALSPNTSFCLEGPCKVRHIRTDASKLALSHQETHAAAEPPWVFLRSFLRQIDFLMKVTHKHQAIHCKDSTEKMPTEKMQLFFFFLPETVLA